MRALLTGPLELGVGRHGGLELGDEEEEPDDARDEEQASMLCLKPCKFSMKAN